MPIDEQAFDPEAITAVLRHFAWSPESKIPGLYEVWTPDDSEEDDEIMIPLDPSRGDYSGLLERARKRVLSHYGRSAQDVLAIFEVKSRASLDTTQWEKETSLEAGIIGWEEGEGLYQAARLQLVAAAKATRERRRYHGNASSHIARRFIENTFMGQTDIGSFIITAHTPSSQRFHISKHSEEVHLLRPRDSETISGREIISTFDQALHAVRESLDEYKRTPRPEVFIEAVNEGVSYEFTKALSEITGGGGSEIKIRTAQGDHATYSTYSFEAVDSPILAKAAISFAQDPEPQEVTLVGEVTLLSRSSATSDRIIRLNIERGADVRKARIHLTAEQYDIAMEAHRQEASLKVSGILEKEGRLYWLYNPSDVEIIPDEDDGVSEQHARFATPPIFDI